jgi:hypothetical protein
VPWGPIGTIDAGRSFAERLFLRPTEKKTSR